MDMSEPNVGVADEHVKSHSSCKSTSSAKISNKVSTDAKKTESHSKHRSSKTKLAPGTMKLMLTVDHSDLTPGKCVVKTIGQMMNYGPDHPAHSRMAFAPTIHESASFGGTVGMKFPHFGKGDWDSSDGDSYHHIIMSDVASDKAINIEPENADDRSKAAEKIANKNSAYRLLGALEDARKHKTVEGEDDVYFVRHNPDLWRFMGSTVNNHSHLGLVADHVAADTEGYDKLDETGQKKLCKEHRRKLHDSYTRGSRMGKDDTLMVDARYIDKYHEITEKSLPQITSVAGLEVGFTLDPRTPDRNGHSIIKLLVPYREQK